MGGTGRSGSVNVRRRGWWGPSQGRVRSEWSQMWTWASIMAAGRSGDGALAPGGAGRGPPAAGVGEEQAAEILGIGARQYFDQVQVPACHQPPVTGVHRV